MVKRKTDDTEQNCQNNETHKLDWLASNSVDSEHGNPVSRNSTRTNQDKVAYSVVVQFVVDIVLGRVTNLCEDNRIIETETIESDIQKEPRACSSEKNLPKSPLPVVPAEVGPRRLRDFELRTTLHGFHTADLVDIPGRFACKVGSYVCVTSLYITCNIKCVSRGFGNGKAVVESNASRDGAEADHDTPHSVNGGLTANIACIEAVCGDCLGLESDCDDESQKSSSKLANSLHRKHSSHHCTAPFGGCESEEKY